MENYTVQLVSKDDKEKIIELLKIMHSEYDLFPLDERELEDTIDRMINKTGGVIGVIKSGDRIEALIGLFLDKMWYSKQWFLSEVFTFVHQDFRRSTRAKHLINYAKECAEKMNLPLLMGITSNIRTEAKMKLYERQLDKMGSFFVHNKECVGA
ncbi:MAG: hypothetical protein WCR52_23735 [Bacteroidota bacterium]